MNNRKKFIILPDYITFLFRMLRISFFLLLTCLWTYTIKAQTTAPKYSNEFLKLGVGADAAGMGNTRIGIANDVTSGYWNPAGIAFIEEPQLALMHNEYFAGIAKYDYGAYAMPLQDNRYFGASFLRFAIDDIPNTLNFKDGNSFNYDKITSFSVADMALLLTYAQKFQDQLALGANLKIIHRKIGDFANAWGFGIDIGARYSNEKFHAGVILKDVTTTFNAWTFNTELFEDVFAQTGNEIPQNSIELTLPSLNFGAGYTLGDKEKWAATFALDFQTNFDGKRNVLANISRVSFDPHLGLEGTFKNIVFLRAGVMNFQKLTNLDNKKVISVYPTAGIGFNIMNFAQIDYALSNIGNLKQNLYSHIFSLRLNLGKILQKNY